MCEHSTIQKIKQYWHWYVYKYTCTVNIFFKLLIVHKKRCATVDVNENTYQYFYHTELFFTIRWKQISTGVVFNYNNIIPVLVVHSSVGSRIVHTSLLHVGLYTPSYNNRSNFYSCELISRRRTHKLRSLKIIWVQGNKIVERENPENFK